MNYKSYLLLLILSATSFKSMIPNQVKEQRTLKIRKKKPIGSAWSACETVVLGALKHNDREEKSKAEPVAPAQSPPPLTIGRPHTPFQEKPQATFTQPSPAEMAEMFQFITDLLENDDSDENDDPDFSPEGDADFFQMLHGLPSR